MRLVARDTGLKFKMRGTPLSAMAMEFVASTATPRGEEKVPVAANTVGAPPVTATRFTAPPSSTTTKFVLVSKAKAVGIVSAVVRVSWRTPAPSYLRMPPSPWVST